MVVLICISLMSNIEQSLVFFCNPFIFFDEVLVQVFCPFKIIFQLLNFKNDLYILEMSPLWGIFLPVFGFSFYSLNRMSFKEQNFLILMNSNLSDWGVIKHDLHTLLRNLCLTQGHKEFPPMFSLGSFIQVLGFIFSQDLFWSNFCIEHQT